MRIVHVNTNRNWGGGEKQILELLRGSEAAGVHNTLLAHPDGALLARSQQITGCTRIGFRANRTPLKVLQLCSVLRRTQADVLHLHDGRALPIAVPAATMLRIPLVLHRRIASPVRSNVVSRALYGAGCIAAFIAVSESAKQSLLHAGVPRARIDHIPSGIDCRQMRPEPDRSALRSRLGLADHVWIGTVGTLDRKKGIDTFLRASAALARRNPRWRYLIVGGGPEQQSLQGLAAQLGIAEQVYFTGFVDNACDYIAAMDTFAFASLREGSPGVLKEAMALRVPVVAANAPGTDEVLTRATGILTPAQDPEAMATAIEKVMATRDATRRMVDCAHARVQSQYSMHRTVQATIEVYERVRQRVERPCATSPKASRSAGTRSSPTDRTASGRRDRHENLV